MKTEGLQDWGSFEDAVRIHTGAGQQVNNEDKEQERSERSYTTIHGTKVVQACYKENQRYGEI